MPLDYKKFAREVSETLLEMEVDSMHDEGVEKHLCEIAVDLTDWEDLAHHLNMSRRKVEDIKKEYTKPKEAR